MTISEQHILSALENIIDPTTGKTYIANQAIQRIQIDGNNVALDIELGYPANSVKAEVQRQIISALQTIPGVDKISVAVSSKIVPHGVQGGVKLIPGIKNIIAVASGKGGVGKSATAVNLALALAAEGANVGILDADIYGPSQPQMLGITQQPESLDGKSMEPVIAHGIQAMSIGLLIDVETPMVWRGPMVTQALQQLLNDTNWKDVDYLIVDMPPGTGDIQLTLAQKIPVTGAVIVTTPQDIALLDARKGLKMFEKVGIPIFGIIENMSTHTCSNCGHTEPIFGTGGGEKMCRDYAVDFLGALPLDIQIREHTDSGKPSVIADPSGKIAETYRMIARKIAVKIGESAEDHTDLFAKIIMEND
ncbi:iron-sulfur cluster carrier protein ApbC [Nitrosomonas sp.]|uniref:iron-sulfur cluster carrier protein ApbC n=2 Tax=Nitrosomonas sp. TaxID=42353 RepID=UPI002841B70B|nr:iron-sulfur cluster carrier protein ApbC [Nitrosomonas sp.]MCP5244396.1 iron-sulfur cluster carrier protein ApbC [Burkholderiales bacterium]MDR4515010.1 iron-sulfur cluster carrier protein ApbC [Nitrosomonas sp.]